MIDRVFWMFSKLPRDRQMRVILSREGWEVLIDDEDKLSADDNCITIYRKNGNLVVINPEHIVMLCTIKKGAFL